MTIKGVTGERTLFFWSPPASGSYYNKYDGFTSNQLPNYNPYAATVSNNYYSETSLAAGNQFGLISFFPSFSFRVHFQIV